MDADCPDLQRFLRGELDAASFHHREHVRMAFEILARHDFAEAALHFSRTLRAMAARAGKPQAFHQTVTIAFLSLIAERMEAGHDGDFAVFVAISVEAVSIPFNCAGFDDRVVVFAVVITAKPQYDIPRAKWELLHRKLLARYF